MGFVGFIGVHESSAQKNVEIFMLIPPIKGESTDDRHKDWINVISLRQTLEQASGSPTAGQSPQQTPRTACQIEIIKFLDRAGPLLWAAAVTGIVFPEVQIEVVTSVDKQKIYEIRLTNAKVSSISTASGVLNPTTTQGTFPLESVVLAAASALLTYTRTDETGKPSGQVTATIDCGPGGR